MDGVLLVGSAACGTRWTQSDSCISAANGDKSTCIGGKGKRESIERELGLGSPAFVEEYYILKAVVLSSIDSRLCVACC